MLENGRAILYKYSWELVLYSKCVSKWNYGWSSHKLTLTLVYRLTNLLTTILWNISFQRMCVSLKERNYQRSTGNHKLNGHLSDKLCFAMRQRTTFLSVSVVYACSNKNKSSCILSHHLYVLPYNNISPHIQTKAGRKMGWPSS